MANESYIYVTNYDLLIALVFIGVAAFISYRQRLGLEKDIAIGAMRTFVQLLLVGYVLQQIFNASRWYWVILALSVMIVVAGYNAMKRQAGAKEGLFVIMTGAIAGAAAITLIIVVGVVLKVRPWYQPRYVIPIAGMIIGNTMNAAALAVNRLHSELKLRRNEVEASLALGAPVVEASSAALREALRAAMLPTINSMMTVGLVQLPGMMTGQIIAGQNPTEAVRYQIIVQLMLAGAAALTSIAASYRSLRVFFTPAQQFSPRLELGTHWDAYVSRERRTRRTHSAP